MIQQLIHSQLSLNAIANSAKQLIAPSTQTTGAAGTRNERGRSGRVLRSTSTPMQTVVNASSVPIETRSPSTLIGSRPARIAAMMPTMIWPTYGVWYFGCTLPNSGGTRPSFAIV